MKRMMMVFYVAMIVLTIYNIYNSFVNKMVLFSILTPLLLAFWIYKCISWITKVPPEPKRVPCTYPMNLFHNFEDEVPDGTRVSTLFDCIDCNDMDCAKSDAKYCLIG